MQAANTQKKNERTIEREKTPIEKFHSFESNQRETRPKIRLQKYVMEKCAWVVEACGDGGPTATMAGVPTLLLRPTQKTTQMLTRLVFCGEKNTTPEMKIN